MQLSDNMDGSQGGGAVSANSSSDFVSRSFKNPGMECVVLIIPPSI